MKYLMNESSLSNKYFINPTISLQTLNSWTLFDYEANLKIPKNIDLCFVSIFLKIYFVLSSFVLNNL